MEDLSRPDHSAEIHPLSVRSVVYYLRIARKRRGSQYDVRIRSTITWAPTQSCYSVTSYSTLNQFYLNLCRLPTELLTASRYSPSFVQQASSYPFLASSSTALQLQDTTIPTRLVVLQTTEYATRSISHNFLLFPNV